MTFQANNDFFDEEKITGPGQFSIQELAEAQRLLLLGESPTGDELYDGVIGFYGHDLDEFSTAVSTYENIQSILDGKLNQPIVSVLRYVSGPNLGNGQLKNTRCEISLGIIDSQKITFDFSRRTIYIRAKPVLISTKTGPDSESFFFPYDSYDQRESNPTAQIKLRNESARSNARSTDIIASQARQTTTDLLVGNDQIDQWLAAAINSPEAIQLVELFNIFKDTYDQLPQTVYLSDLLWASKK